ncbi:MAG TPA: hypothetical protein VNT60_00335 [Deinococcales bacterium]|nr:hypothetical protein [Deinococcales bacterium]
MSRAGDYSSPSPYRPSGEARITASKVRDVVLMDLLASEFRLRRLGSLPE